jgi:hypothetical protein
MTERGTFEELLVEAYRGEIFGEAFFGTMAAGESDPARLEMLRLLEQIEARTRGRLHPLVDELGLDPGDEAAPQRDGVDLATAVVKGPWVDFVQGLRHLLPGFLADFVRLRELSDDPDHPALAELVAHEQTISAFADLELAGHHDEARAVLARYLG